MPALRFKTCRLLPGNVWKRKLSKIQRRILQRLRRRGKSIKRNLFMRENRNSNIKLQTLRKLSLFYARENRRLALFQKCDIIMGRSHTRECIPRRWSRVFPTQRKALIEAEAEPRRRALRILCILCEALGPPEPKP